MTVWDLVREAAAAHPERVLLRDEHGRSLTAVALRDAAEQVAAGLGLTDATVLSWQLPTAIESVVLMLAAARVGAVQNPIIPILRDQEVRHITGAIATSTFVVPERWRGVDHGEMARAIAGEHGFDVVTVGDDLRLPTGDPATLPPPPTSDDEGRWLYFTSGTTGTPKGVRHTDASVIASSLGMTELMGIGEGDVYPIAWPITHIGGVTMTTSVLRAGGTLVLFDSFDPATIGDRMAAVHPTLLGTGVPFFRAYLDAQRRHGEEPLYPQLRAFAAGGAPTPPELVRELREVFGRDVLESYGLTEFPIATTLGRPSPGVDVRVVDGELRLKGPQCFLGYVDAAMDAEAFDDEGWLRTGDLAEVDVDGNVTITGRRKDIIIRNAENISALEVEGVLLRHPDIVDAAVIGLPDPRTGERVCAVVVTAPGRTVDLDAVAAHFRAQGVARQKTPEQLAIVDAIARNPMGKVVKSDLVRRVYDSRR